MYRIVWEFDAAPEGLKDFEREYGPAGKWTEFFRRSPEYVGTELFRSIESPNRFITLGTWRTRQARQVVRTVHPSRAHARHGRRRQKCVMPATVCDG